jgi:5-formyltetrahydrofolate cyclo-ligase
MRAARKAYVVGLTADERAALESALAAIVRCHLPEGAIMGSYAPHGAEIDPGGISSTAALPWFADAMSECVFRSGPARERGPFGVRQPRGQAAPVQPDVILTPLLAADKRGYRLGQGGGHYDRLLAGLPDRGAVMVIGVAWDIQIIDHVPEDPWDMALDAVATPARWIVPAPAG